MIFVDTSAFYALANRADPHHAGSVSALEGVLRAGERLATHNYVLVETMALLQHRLGRPVAAAFARGLPALEVVWIDSARHTEAERRFERRRSRRVSFVDEVSFLVMRSSGIRTAFAYDQDFVEEGFASLS